MAVPMTMTMTIILHGKLLLPLLYIDSQCSQLVFVLLAFAHLLLRELFHLSHWIKGHFFIFLARLCTPCLRASLAPRAFSSQPLDQRAFLHLLGLPRRPKDLFLHFDFLHKKCTKT